MNAVGFHIIVKKETVEVGGGLSQKETRYKIEQTGDDAKPDMPKGQYAIIRAGTEGEPIQRGSEIFYIVHLDNILATED